MITITGATLAGTSGNMIVPGQTFSVITTIFNATPNREVYTARLIYVDKGMDPMSQGIKSGAVTVTAPPSWTGGKLDFVMDARLTGKIGTSVSVYVIMYLRCPAQRESNCPYVLFPVGTVTFTSGETRPSTKPAYISTARDFMPVEPYGYGRTYSDEQKTVRAPYMDVDPVGPLAIEAEPLAYDSDAWLTSILGGTKLGQMAGVKPPAKNPIQEWADYVVTTQPGYTPPRTPKAGALPSKSTTSKIFPSTPAPTPTKVIPPPASPTKTRQQLVQEDIARRQAEYAASAPPSGIGCYRTRQDVDRALGSQYVCEVQSNGWWCNCTDPDAEARAVAEAEAAIARKVAAEASRVEAQRQEDERRLKAEQVRQQALSDARRLQYSAAQGCNISVPNPEGDPSGFDAQMRALRSDVCMARSLVGQPVAQKKYDRPREEGTAAKVISAEERQKKLYIARTPIKTTTVEMSIDREGDMNYNALVDMWRKRR